MLTPITRLELMGSVNVYRHFALTAAIAAVLSVPVQPAQAGNAEKAVIGGLGALGVLCATGVICNTAQPQAATPQRQRQQQTRAPRGPTPAQIAQREENRQVQTALNGFGFPVGTPDGVFGPATRTGISNYQAYMGYQPTGQLADYQKQELLSGYDRFNSGGGAAYASAMQSDGTKGLLKAFRGDPGYGSQQQAAQPPVPPTPQPSDAPPAIVEASTPKPGLPNLPRKGLAGDSGSMADRCELVDLMGRTNGLAMPGRISDPDLAMSEQFCAMRGYAITESQTLLTSYGLTPETAEAQICGPVVNAMKSEMAQLPGSAPVTLAAAARNTVSGLGVTDPDLIRDYGKICLGVGYQLNNPQDAMAGAIVAMSQNDYGYAEVLAHHLREGFGVAKDSAAAQPYYDAALSAIESGAQPTFLPAQAQVRDQIMREALSQGSTQAELAPAPGVAVSTQPMLPLLSRSNP